jgi:hypothetical protein
MSKAFYQAQQRADWLKRQKAEEEEAKKRAKEEERLAFLAKKEAKEAERKKEEEERLNAEAANAHAVAKGGKPAPPEPPKPAQHCAHKRYDCNHYVHFGTCKYGASCKFHHPSWVKKQFEKQQEDAQPAHLRVENKELIKKLEASMQELRVAMKKAAIDEEFEMVKPCVSCPRVGPPRRIVCAGGGDQNHAGGSDVATRAARGRRGAGAKG